MRCKLPVLVIAIVLIGLAGLLLPASGARAAMSPASLLKACPGDVAARYRASVAKGYEMPLPPPAVSALCTDVLKKAGIRDRNGLQAAIDARFTEFEGQIVERQIKEATDAVRETVPDIDQLLPVCKADLQSVASRASADIGGAMFYTQDAAGTAAICLRVMADPANRRQSIRRDAIRAKLATALEAAISTMSKENRKTYAAALPATEKKLAGSHVVSCSASNNDDRTPLEYTERFSLAGRKGVLLGPGAGSVFAHIFNAKIENTLGGANADVELFVDEDMNLVGLGVSAEGGIVNTSVYGAEQFPFLWRADGKEIGRTQGFFHSGLRRIVGRFDFPAGQAGQQLRAALKGARIDVTIVDAVKQDAAHTNVVTFALDPAAIRATLLRLRNVVRKEGGTAFDAIDYYGRRDDRMCGLQ
ncbi:hypothetical protein HL653_18120 [Sphingomonas sp. AP4-R1]|uniref:hypothetical protein n=1 Tax=Sphingomonas sp. AP4-R1 TaxID=2735134 RepID=UPI001493928B|nr:hypothetical protein [Sphingomonas sp. AP4-R1]QJU59415.1 hypothetical protein HL653_18120 [Sphingomonas sp. AP4-R1]